MLKAFTTLDTSKHAALKRTVTALLDRQNFGGADTLVIPGEYLEVVVTKA